MRGIVLAAGGGTRLRPLTDALPKTLLAVDGERSILELAVSNLRAVGVTDVTVVTGHAAEAIEAARPVLEAGHDIRLRLVWNERFADWNNAYSLWLALDGLDDAALLVNGDTVHPPSVERRLLARRGDAPVLLALDDGKALGAEEMKVEVDSGGRLTRINKAVDPVTASGEYIGVSLIEPAAADELADALVATFKRDPSLYYEDGFQEHVERGNVVRTVPIGAVDWVEVDDHADLTRAREIACRC